MLPPANHHLTVTDQRGKQIRGKGVYLQPQAERWREDSAVVHIENSDWRTYLEGKIRCLVSCRRYLKLAHYWKLR